MTRLHLIPAALLLAAVPLATPLYGQREGVAHPENITVAEMSPAAAPMAAPAPKPSAAIADSAPIGETPDVTAPAAVSHEDPDANIVTYVPSRPNELPIGTMIKVRMSQTVNTKSTLAGTPFTAYLSEPVERDGKVVIPVGAEMHGTVEDVHGGARFFGRASFRLQPDRIDLPDGSHYVINAQVIDTDQYHVTQIGSNGAVIKSDHAKSTAAVFTLVTGASAAAGAVFGGAPGALIGAAVGGSISTAKWLRQDSEIHLPVESRVVFSLTTSMPETPLH